MPYYHTLKKNLGDDFEYVMPFGEEYEDDSEYSPLSKIDSETIKSV